MNNLNSIFKVLVILLALLVTSIESGAKEPDCAKPEGWAGSSAFAALKNANLLTNDEVNFDKTEVSKISSNKISKDLYRQVHLVVFTKKNGGQQLSAITVSDASNKECSAGGIDIFVISKQLGIGPIKILQKTQEENGPAQQDKKD